MSNLNLLAFVANTSIADSESEHSLNHIYIIDLNLPNEPHLIKNHQCRVTALEWDHSGQKLLIGDVDGACEVWSRKDYLINQWQMVYKQICFEGEHVLYACWYKNTLHHRINLAKHDLQAPYNEKFSLAKFEPTVKQFGKKAADGIVCISNSGMIWTACFASDGTILTNRQVLGETQHKLQLVDVSYRLNGELQIATSNGLTDYPINFYSVSIKQLKTDCLERNQLVIRCEDSYSTFPKSVNQSNGENKTHKFITHLRFVTREEANAILVACAGDLGSSLEIWELHERNSQLHKRFMNAENQAQTVRQWSYSSSLNYSRRIVALTIINSSIYDCGPKGKKPGAKEANRNLAIQPYIVVAYQDNQIKLLLKEKLQTIRSLNLKESAYKSPSDSRVTNLLHVDDMQFTWSGSGLVVIDNAGQLFLYKMPAITNHQAELYPNQFVVMLLEYSMLNSFDWWDILLNVNPSQIEAICDRFTENFKQYQHSAIQQKYQHKYLAIKGSIYRISNSPTIGLNKSGDCYATALLHSIADLIKMILRTTNKNADKEGPVENISNIIQNNPTELQLTKVMLILENKDFAIEHAILQSLQHLNQWIGDLALYLVGSYPQSQNGKFPGGGLLNDAAAINTLRELLVIIQVWGLVNDSCLPVFTKLNDSDVMASLYRLLTRSISFVNCEPDEHLLEEYCNLPNNVMIPHLDLTLKARGIISPPLYFVDWPLTLHYFREASFLSYQQKMHSVDGAIHCNPNGKIDVIRRIGLGKSLSNGNKNTNMRICTRCESISLLQTIIKTPATLAWDSTWQKQCLCGGHWKLLENNF